MSTEIPSAIQLIQQWLHENGYPNTLKEFETECALDFVEDDVQMGGHLETILSEYADFKNAASVTDTQKEGKRSLEKLLEPGAGDYVKKGTASFANIHKANVLSVAFNHDPENLYMASGSTDKTIKLFTIPKQDDSSFTPEILAEFTAHTGAVISLDFNPKFKNLLLSSSMDGTVSVTDVTSKNVLQTFVNHSKYVVQVKWHFDGLTFACASHDHSASIYKKDETEGVYKLVEKIPFNGNVEALAFSNDGKLVMSVRDDNYLQIYDLATSTKTKFNMNAKGDDHVSFTALHMQFSPDGEYLLVNTDKDRLILYSMSSGSVPVRNFYGANNDIYSQPRCCWHLSGKYVYSTSQDNKIYCWDVATQKVVTRLEGHKGVVRDLTQHPTLNMIGSSSFDKTIKLWSQ